ncbi:peptidase [Paracoccus sp. 1_MG-2023]|uniref:NlpC/P60 family protein n=1 Tax=unclassified Paracoccus (in: a-proteobacteria) TaxID=2688777 RepID=UPI001C07F675|nr:MULTISPECIES: NlpC/P60 family protein [unclassified Paracoccus (in: a-proteobacteria)]MBU2958639.1 peptidase [Paracoccus sp. C2R09]MDO6667632.1 peptidase [Paracoccus sp. 1_MG-2023]
MSEVVRIAEGWIGTPYVHQASTRGCGTDCLGLLRGVWRELQGAEPETPPAYTADWAECGRDEVLWNAAMRHMDELPAADEWQAGQVLLFRMRQGAIAKHLGILSHDGLEPRFIHAYNYHGVIESPLTRPWAARVVARFRFP